MKKTIIAALVAAASFGVIAHEAVTTNLPNGTEITATAASLYRYSSANYLKDTVEDNGGTNIKHTRELPGSGRILLIPYLTVLYSEAVLDILTALYSYKYLW